MLRSIGLPELILFGVLILFAAGVIKASRFARGSIIGIFVGAVVGFLLRPSVPVIGQLPLGVVITRGSNLGGVDLLFRSTAEQSFNYMLIGAILGAIVLGAVGRFNEKPFDHKEDKQNPASPAPPDSSRQSPVSKFCTKCGASLSPDIVFCGACGTRRS